MEMLAGRTISLIAGVWLVTASIGSAIRTLVLPRSAPDAVTRFVFGSLRRIFALRLKRTTSYLDAAALTLSSLEVPFDARAALCLRAGYLALPPLFMRQK